MAGRRFLAVASMLVGALIGAAFVVHGLIVYPLVIAFAVTAGAPVLNGDQLILGTPAGWQIEWERVHSGEAAMTDMKCARLFARSRTRNCSGFSRHLARFEPAPSFGAAQYVKNPEPATAKSTHLPD